MTTSQSSLQALLRTRTPMNTIRINQRETRGDVRIIVTATDGAISEFLLTADEDGAPIIVETMPAQEG